MRWSAYVVGAGGIEPPSSSVSGKNQPKESGWHRAFLQVNGRLGVSGTDCSCPRVSAGTCPRCAPSAILDQQQPARECRAGYVVLLLGLQQPHVGRLGALRPRRHVELDSLALSERAVAGRLDRAEVHEDVLAGLLRDEAVALLGVEPLHGSNRHVLVPPSTVLEVSTNAGPDLGTGGKGQARPAGCEANVNLCRAHHNGYG